MFASAWSLSAFRHCISFSASAARLEVFFCRLNRDSAILRLGLTLGVRDAGFQSRVKAHKKEFLVLLGAFLITIHLRGNASSFTVRIKVTSYDGIMRRHSGR